MSIVMAVEQQKHHAIVSPTGMIMFPDPADEATAIPQSGTAGDKLELKTETDEHQGEQSGDQQLRVAGNVSLDGANTTVTDTPVNGTTEETHQTAANLEASPSSTTDYTVEDTKAQAQIMLQQKKNDDVTTPAPTTADQATHVLSGAGKNGFEGNCHDTADWTNLFTDLTNIEKEQFLEHEALMDEAGHQSKLFVDGQNGGMTCYGYVLTGFCINPAWYDSNAVDYPCLYITQRGGIGYNSPENNCCGCGKFRSADLKECSSNEDVMAWMRVHEQKYADMIETAFDHKSGASIAGLLFATAFAIIA